MTSQDTFMIEVATVNAQIVAERDGLEGDARAAFIAEYVTGAIRSVYRLREVINHPAFDGPDKWTFHSRAFAEIDAPLDEIAKAIGAGVPRQEKANAGTA